MTHGTGSTLILHPKGGTVITFNLSASTVSVTTYTMIVDAGRLDLNEEARYQWVYDQNRTGGRVAGNTVQLVPVTFSVIIKATSSDYRKAAYRVLQQAVMNKRGGTLQYKPEGAVVGTLDTYYHYVASKPPRLLDEPGNRWDSDADADGFYSLQVDVELATQPFATSDPDNPIDLLDGPLALSNWYTYGVYTNRLSITAGLATVLQGSLPALVRLLITPASGQRLGRVIVFQRSDEDGTLANLVTVYEAEDATTVPPTSAWSEIVDADRGGGKYVRCLPNFDANGVAHGLKFTLTHPGDGKGRFAVFGIGYDDGASAGIWTHQVKLYSGNIAQTGDDDYYASLTQSWQVIFAGEFELPLSDLSDLTTGYDVGPYLEWYSTRASGASEFRLDAIVLVWVSDSLGPDGEGTALDVVCDDADDNALTGGVEYPDKLLIENLTGLAGVVTGRAYVAASDNDIARVLNTAPRGDFIELEPGHDHLLVFIQERATGPLFTDDFENYISVYIKSLDTFDNVSGWTYSNFTLNTAGYVEGTGKAQITFDVPKLDHKTVDLDLESDDRFTDADFIVLFVDASFVDDFDSFVIAFLSSDISYYYATVDSIAGGYNFITIKKSDFVEQSSPDLSKIKKLEFIFYPKDPCGHAITLRLDYLRIEKADPDNANVPNATGDVWNFQPEAGAWTITEDITEDSPGATLACFDVDAGVEKVALLDKNIPNDIRLRARVYDKTFSGTVGVLWRAGEDCLTEGTEDGYALTVGAGGNHVSVVRYDNGTPTTLYTTGMDIDSGRWYTLGVESKDDEHRVYAALSSTLLYDDSKVFEGDYLKKSLTDATYSSGDVGFLSQSTLGRFDDVVIESIEDKVVPADQITVSGQVVFRTIAPFD